MDAIGSRYICKKNKWRFGSDDFPFQLDEFVASI